MNSSQFAVRSAQTLLCVLTAYGALRTAHPVFAATSVKNLPGVIDAKKTSSSRVPLSPAQSELFDLILELNRLPETQLTDKTGPAAPLLQKIQEKDGPDYLKIRSLLARGDVRKTLTASVKGMVAGLVTPRWDCF